MFTRCRGTTAALAAAAAACASGSAQEYPGVSDAPHSAERSADPAPEPPRRWGAWQTVSSWPSATPRPFEAHSHFGGGFLLDVRVDPQSRDRYANWAAGATLGPGATLAALHTTPDGVAGPVFAMLKGADGAWQFLVVSPSGTLEPTSPLCRRCHAEARSDFVFGLSSTFTETDGGASSGPE